MAIPFKSLRYNSGANQVWGINIRRVIRRKNEWTHLTPIPAAAGVPGGMFRLSRAGTLVGLDLPEASKNVELKPYGIARSTTDRAVAPQTHHDRPGDVGVDAKYGVTANLMADFTVNTDFAQVEVDEQQVNLTRFSCSIRKSATSSWKAAVSSTSPAAARRPPAPRSRRALLQPPHRPEWQPHHSD